MKFKKIGITAGLIICLIGVNIQGTFGLENEGEVSDQTQTDILPAEYMTGGSAEGNTADGETGGENLPGSDTEDSDSGDVNDDQDQTGQDQNDEEETSKDQTGKDEIGQDQIGKEENNKEQTGEDESSKEQTGGDENGKDQTGEDQSNEDKNNGTDQNPEADAGRGSAEDGSQDGSGTADKDSILTVPVQDDTEEEELYNRTDSVIADNSPDAVYTGNIYSPSDVYIDSRDKVKYNAALPIEGLPAFITQEMVIGALKCQDETGYPASVTIAQIIQESGFGSYGPEGEHGMGLSYLAFQYNNLFGIKGTGPAGSVDMRTGEQTALGESYMTTAGFRVYNTYTECIEDRTELLKEVYSDLTGGVTDANTFAMKIGSRWATDIRYAQSLIRQMETYDLYRLDRMTLKNFSEMIGTFADPCPGASMTSSFGMREFRNSFHKGIDLGTGIYNIPTYAAEAGTVIVAGWSDSAGSWVVIDHGNGLVTKYMHHDKLYVKEGQHVEKGQQIGLSGTTGDSTGNHLHFQVEENGTAVDPAVYLGLEQ